LKAATKRGQSMAAEPKRARSAWRRGVENQDESAKLGQRLRAFREQQQLSLNAASEVTGVPAATLSRIETNKMAPTFGLMLKLMKGLGLTWADLMLPGGIRAVDQQISVARPEDLKPVVFGGESFAPLHPASPLNFRVAPVFVELSAKTPAETGGPAAHAGIEFCYVLSGTLVIHFPGRPPQEVPTGGSALFNSEIPHAYVSKGRGPARFLIVSGTDPLAAESADPSMLWAGLINRFQNAAPGAEEET
jgi:transcriptional regulator with XRE-family HTH domain